MSKGIGVRHDGFLLANSPQSLLTPLKHPETENGR